MFSLDKFLEFFKESKTLIPTLLAIILVGGIGGGLWIHTLNEKVDYYKGVVTLSDTLYQKQMKIIKDGRDEEFKSIRRRLGDLKYDTKRILNQNNEINDSINSYILQVENVVKLVKGPKADSGLLYLSKIKNDYVRHEHEVTKIDSAILKNELFSANETKLLPFKKIMTTTHQPSSYYYLLLLLLVSYLIVYLSYRIIKRLISKSHSQKSKPSNKKP